MERSTSVGLGLGEKRKERDEGGGDLVGLNPLHAFYCTSGGVTGDFYEGARVWQPYSSPYKAPVMPMRVFPFTSAQWQELQRQALIYKHIMASVPVPPDLLFPLSARAFPEALPLLIPSTVVHGVGNGVAGFNLRFSNSTDPEPGRCRRTDGKKWRCSRDAAPDQKYCERHMHRGRPRSRKPVELRNKNNNSESVKSATPVDTDMITVNRSNTSQTTGLLPKLDLKLPFRSMEPTKDTRYQGNLASNQQWVQQQYQDLPNLNYSTELNHRCCPFLNPDLSAFEENAVAGNEPPPRTFIDAWSTEYASAAATTNPTKTMPNLTLSMSNNANGIEDEIKMGLGLAVKSINWTGGPLAEVLQSTSNMTSPSGSSKCCSCVDPINLMCKGCCESQEVSPRDSPSQVAASPSGVLHKALVSLSDSSSSSSPTFAAVASRPEVAFQWLNQSK